MIFEVAIKHIIDRKKTQVDIFIAEGISVDHIFKILIKYEKGGITSDSCLYLKGCKICESGKPDHTISVDQLPVQLYFINGTFYELPKNGAFIRKISRKIKL